MDSYTKFCLTQRLEELKKAIKRQWTKSREDEFKEIESKLNDR